MTTKNLVYKIARFNNEANGNDLQSLLSNALKTKSAALSRRQSTDHEGQFRLINYNGPFKGLRVGEMFDYTRGHQQPTAEFDDDADQLELSSIAPPDNKMEFLHSILYFGIKGNAVILAQSTSLKALQFEEYINWMLREVGVLSDKDFVALCDQPPIEKDEELGNTKGIEIKAPVYLSPSKTPPARQSEITDTKSISLKPSGSAWEALRTLLPAEINLPSKLSSSDIVRERSLEVRLFLTWSNNQKDDSTDLMDGISNQLRHVDSELDYTIHTRSGKITRDEIKLKKPVSVPTDSKGLVRRDEMWERIRNWLNELVSDDKIVIDA